MSYRSIARDDYLTERLYLDKTLTLKWALLKQISHNIKTKRRGLPQLILFSIHHYFLAFRRQSVYFGKISLVLKMWEINLLFKIAFMRQNQLDTQRTQPLILA